MKLHISLEFSEDELFDFMYNDIYKEYQKCCVRERLRYGLQKKNEKELVSEKFPQRSRCKKGKLG